MYGKGGASDNDGLTQRRSRPTPLIALFRSDQCSEWPSGIYPGKFISYASFVSIYVSDINKFGAANPELVLRSSYAWPP